MAVFLCKAFRFTLESAALSCRSASRCFSTSSSLWERKWLWPLDYAAHMMDVGHKHGTRFTPAIFVFNTSQPLSSDLMLQAMVHIWRKVPNVRVAIGRREGSPWYYEAENMNLDFQEVDEGSDPIAIIEGLNELGFPEEEGTALRFRLTKAAPGAPCPIPELLREFPFQYNLIAHPHHGIYDGVSFSCVIQTLTEVLDCLLQGKEIDDHEQVGKFEPYDEIYEKDAKIEARLKADPQLLDSLKKELLSCNQEPQLLKALPPPGCPNPKTKYVIRYIDNHLFKQMHIACKNNGVTFNAALMASINTTIVDFLKEAGLTDEEFPISVTNATNLRRYLTPKSYDVMGLLVRSTSQMVQTKRDVRQHFWEYSRDIHRDLHRLIKSEAALEQEVVRKTSLNSVLPESFYSNPGVVREYGMTNMGDLTPFMPGEGKLVQMTGVTLLAVVHKYIYMCLHQVFTHRRNTSYSLSYATDYMTEDTANILVDRVLALLEEFTQ